MKFISIESYTYSQLCNIAGATFAIKTKAGYIYDECSIHSTGYAGCREYHFASSGVVIEASSVESIAFEDPTLDPLSDEKNVLRVYELGLGWRGCVICTAYSLEEAKQIMKNQRDGLDEKDFEALNVLDIEGYKYVNYGDE